MIPRRGGAVALEALTVGTVRPPSILSKVVGFSLCLLSNTDLGSIPGVGWQDLAYHELRRILGYQRRGKDRHITEQATRKNEDA